MGVSQAMILEGDARYLRLASLLQLAEAESYSGRIVFGPRLDVGPDATSARARSSLRPGHVAVSRGAVVGAFAGEDLTPLQALHELFFVAEGRVAVELDASVGGSPLGATFALVLDGCRVLDEWEELAPGRWMLAPTVTPAPELAHALEAVRPVLAALETHATLARATDAAGVPRALVTEALVPLVAADVVVPWRPTRVELRLEPPPLPEPKPKPTPAVDEELVDVDELVSRARRLMRANDFDRAEAMLRRALEQRPDDRVLAQNLRHLALRRVHAA